LELTCRSQVNFFPSIPAYLRSWTSSTGKSIRKRNVAGVYLHLLYNIRI
jgi:hypothetical protein